jgi:hypothetical protein
MITQISQEKAQMQEKYLIHSQHYEWAKTLLNTVSTTPAYINLISFNPTFPLTRRLLARGFERGRERGRFLS